MKHLSNASPLDNARWGRVNFSGLTPFFASYTRQNNADEKERKILRSLKFQSPLRSNLYAACNHISFSSNFLFTPLA